MYYSIEIRPLGTEGCQETNGDLESAKLGLQWRVEKQVEAGDNFTPLQPLAACTVAQMAIDRCFFYGTFASGEVAALFRHEDAE